MSIPLTLHDWLAHQERLHPRTIELGLGRATTVLKCLGWSDPPSFLVVTVAGTNGKGSCVATLEAILQTAGYHTATYTSPHLQRYNERIRINGREVSDEELCSAFARIECARGATSLTYFEYGTLAALDLFRRARPDVVILEVGLGGRLDATNIIDADVAVITTIELDHMEWLGADRESIGREKAGIFRSGRPAVCGDPNPPTSLVDHAQALGAPLYIQGSDFSWCRCTHDEQWEWRRHPSGQIYPAEIFYRLPAPQMRGLHQYQNIATVLMALDCLADRLSVPIEAVRCAVSTVAVPGRFQILDGIVPYILDVAHNPQAAMALAATLGTMPKRTVAVVGMLADKDIPATLKAMVGVVDAWYLASLPGARGASALRLAEVLKDLGSMAPRHLYADVMTALMAARTLTVPGDQIVIFGSFQTVAAVLADPTVRLPDGRSGLGRPHG